MVDNQVILSIRLDARATEAELQKLVGDVQATKNQMQALTKARDAEKISTDEYNKGIVDLRLRLKEQTQEQAALTNSLLSFRVATGKATGSVDQLKAQSALLTAQYNALSKEERENTEAGRELTAQLDAVNKALLEAGTRVNDNRRNVGNYASGLRDAVKESGFFGGVTAKVTEAQEAFSGAQVIAKAAIGGNVTALGFLRLALLATGLGALVVVLGSVVAFLTKSQAGVDLMSRKLAGLKAIVSLVTGAAADFGQTLFKAFDNPKQALSDLVDFIGTNLLNRLNSLKIIFDGIASGSINKVSDGLFQLTTGFTDVTGKVKQFTQAALAAAKSGEAIEAESQRILRAERALNVERSQSRARIEELKKLSDDSTKSVLVRTAAAKEAAKIENGLLAQQLKLQDDKIANRTAEANLDKQLTNDELDSIAELRSARADTQQESLTLQTELQNKINSLAQEGLDKTIAGRAQSLALQKALLDQQLVQVQANSDAELSLLRKKLENERQAELNVKDLTVKQKAKIDVDYEAKALKLTQDYTKQRGLAALDEALAANAAELAAVQQGTQQETQLKVEAIEAGLQRELLALDKRGDFEAKAAQLRAAAEKAANEVRYGAAQAATEKYLQDERTALDTQSAQGLVKQAAYDKAILMSDIQAAAMRLRLAQSYGQRAEELEQQLTDAKIAQIKSVTEAERVAQEKRIAFAEQVAGGLVGILQETIETTGASMQDFFAKSGLLLIDSVSKVVIGEQIKVIAQAFSSVESLATFGAAGFAKAFTIIAATSALTGALKAQLVQPGPKQFAQGTVLDGPSHAVGGVQLFSRNGHHYGEAEGGEAIINKRSTALFLPVLSALNELGGGRALTANLPAFPHMALGAIAKPLVMQQLRGNAQPADWERIGKGFADSLRKNPPINKWSHFEAAKKEAEFTESRTSF